MAGKKGKDTKKGKEKETKPKPKKKPEKKEEPQEQTQDLALSLAHDKNLGQIFVKSGFFSDAEDEAQAVVKILAGREVGIEPITAMTGIHIVKGKITLGANLMAAAVKKHPSYNYKVISHTAKECIIEFFEKGESVGKSEYTMEDARKAGILKAGSGWEKYPRNMLFARAMSNGVKWYCPDVFGHSPVYVPEEMGVEVDEEGAPIDVTPQKTPKPFPQDEVKDADFKDEKEEEPEEEETFPKGMVTDKMTPREALKVIMDYAFRRELGDKLRPIIVKHYEPWETGEPDVWNIPEKACIEIVKEINDIELPKAEKVKTCQEEDCKAKITEPEAEEQEGLCLEHFKEHQESE